MFLTENGKKMEKQGKEAIHSGQFMVSHFEAEAQDDDEIAVPIPDIPLKDSFEKAIKPILYNSKLDNQVDVKRFQPIGIETNLSKLFQCMSIAYRQKLTSPKWNRFRGIRLRWKDKIRLNNVIWRCWHMQFIKKQNTLICQFASPLDVDTHNKPEAIVMEGKYWKRKLEAVTAEYKKWRMFYKNQSSGYIRDANDLLEMELMKCELSNVDGDGMLIDEDYMGLMSDTLFSTITNHPFAFPDTREIAKAGLADFIQPSLGPLQPNLPNNDFMDTIEHLDLLSGKLPTVPEENGSDAIYNKSLGWDYNDLMNSGPMQLNTPNVMEQYQQLPINVNSVPMQNNRQPLMQYDNEIIMQHPVDQYMNRQSQTYQSPVISSKSSKQMKDLSPNQSKPNTSSLGQTVFSKSLESVYCNYPLNSIGSNVSVTDPLRIDNQDEFKMLQNTEPTQPSSQNFRVTPQVSSPKYTSQMAENYKLPPRSHVPSHGSSMITSQQAKLPLKEDKSSNKTRNAHRGRRSRSNTREPLKRPPLQTAISDPSLITPVNSMILSQLLTNDSDNVYPQHTQSLPSSQDSNIRVKEETAQTVCLLPHSSLQIGAVIISPVNVNSVQKTDVLLPSTLTPTSPHIETSSQSLSSPTSPQGSIESPNRDPTQKEQRRSHTHAEQKRRSNIKNGFDMIHSLIPHLNQNPNAKLSKAAMLQKSAEYIVQLRTERDQLKDEMDSLRQQIDSLNTSISNCQSLLPATGAPVSRKREIKMQEMFDDYVRTRTTENWKFWIFSLLFRPLLASFNNFVSTSNLSELYRTTCQWTEQHCTLRDLRPVVFNSLKYLCTKTDILTNPNQLPEEAKKQVISGSSEL